MTDEAQFHTDGTVNKQNCRLWGDEKPRAPAEQELQFPSLTVWCGVGRKGILGPLFFEEGGRAATVTASRYKHMLASFVMPKLDDLGVPRSKVWWQQDGATAHTATSVLNFLQILFPGKVLANGGSLPWPPQSTDLTLHDFFLWGLLKIQVYSQPVRSLRQLKSRICATVRALSETLVPDAVGALPTRLRECVRRGGGHLEHVLPHH